MLGLSTGLHYPKFTDAKIVLSVNRFGWIQGVTHGTFATARQMADPSEVSDNPTANKFTAYRYLAARGASTHRFQRVFFYFQTASVNSIPSNGIFRFNASSWLANTGVILLTSEAFGGDGLTAMAPLDFFNETDYTKPYSIEYDSGSTGWIEISLNSACLNGIGTGQGIIFTMVTHTHDYGDTEATGGSSVQRGVEVRLGDASYPIELILNQ